MAATALPQLATCSRQPLFITGPTAVGKSEVALLLAGKVGGEILSVDSMQVYQGLDLGTAKPGAAERQRVPHHLVDVVDLTEPFDAARFVALANKAVAEIQSRGHTPIFCGGTGLYFKAYLDGLGEAPPSDAELRAELAATPLAELLRELERHDPATLARIDQQNLRRVIRAVEVIRLTGRPFSTQRANWNPGGAAGCRPNLEGGQGRRHAVPPDFFCLSRASEDLHTRINARVDRMFAAGLVEETRRLLGLGLAQNKTAMQAIGYRQVVEHLRGACPLPETIELVKAKTRQFAKRQLTWFRKQADVRWLEQSQADTAAGVASRIKSLCRQ